MRASRAIFACCCLCGAPFAGAAEWSASPVVSWTIDHDSNRALGPGDEGSQGGFLDVDLNLRRATGTTSFSLRPHVGFQRYTNDIAQNAENYALSAAGAWTSDRSSLSTQAAWSRDNTLNNELADTGTFTGSSRRVSKTALMAWTFAHAAHRKLDVQLRYSDIQYENLQYFNFFNIQVPYVSLYGYRYPSVTVTETMQWSERSSVQLTAYANRLMSQNEAGDSDSYGAQVGFSRALNERLALSVSAGLSRETGETSSETGYIGRLELTRQDVMGQWSVFAERNVSPSAYGYLVTRNEAGLSFTRSITPRTGLFASARGIWNESDELAQSGERRHYSRAETGVQWNATRSWRLNLAMSYSRAQFAQGALQTDSWRAMAGASWSPQPQRLSR